MRVIAVDPGLRGCGLAYVVDGGLRLARYVESTERTERGGVAWSAMAWALAHVVRGLGIGWDIGVIENPKQYEGAAHAANREDISELSAVAGAVSVILSVGGQSIVSPLPSEWKRQVDKKVHNARVLERLTADEVAAVTWPIGSLRHNVIDAIGLGLWHCGRMKPRKAWE